jgi:hypothetical protein
VAAGDYVYPQCSDPDEQKAEKRRAKNRRTAKASRERKQAELLKLKEDLEASKAEVAHLHQLLQNKDAQIAQLTNPSAGSTQMGGDGGQSTKQRASETAVLETCIYIASCMQPKRNSPPKTAFPSPFRRKCATASGGGDVAMLQQELREVLERVPELQQHPSFWKDLQKAIGRGLRGRSLAGASAEGSDESDLQVDR